MAQQLNHPSKKVVPTPSSSCPRVLRRKNGIDTRQEHQTPPPSHRREIQAGAFHSPETIHASKLELPRTQERDAETKPDSSVKVNASRQKQKLDILVKPTEIYRSHPSPKKNGDRQKLHFIFFFVKDFKERTKKREKLFDMVYR
ncbi:hypothetical protein Bca101_098977 [Brassica carinata]